MSVKQKPTGCTGLVSLGTVADSCAPAGAVASKHGARTMSRGGSREGSQRQACVPPGADGPPGKVSSCAQWPGNGKIRSRLDTGCRAVKRRATELGVQLLISLRKVDRLTPT